MTFSILETDAVEWEEALAALPPPLRDIHYLPQYARIYAQTYGHTAYLALLKTAEGFVMQAFIRRPLASLPFLQGQTPEQAFYDIANPYGYGGPICSCTDDDAGIRLLGEFEREFCRYCAEQRYASEFTSLHPLIENHRALGQLPSPQPLRQKTIVYIDTSHGEDAIWADMRRGHQCAIRQSRREAVRAERVPTSAQNMATFKRLYDSTMTRVGAAARWHFPSDYFSNCINCLGEARTSLFFSYLSDEVIGACLLIHDFGTAYYHFGGTDARFNFAKPGFMMLYEAARWSATQGYRQLHLGGGVTDSPEDNLYKFKKGFSSSTAELFTYARVLNTETYSQLCELKRQHEMATMGRESDSNYFPLYRR